MKTISKMKCPKNEDNLKNEYDLKDKEDLKNEERLNKNEGYLKNEDNFNKQGIAETAKTNGPTCDNMCIQKI